MPCWKPFYVERPGHKDIPVNCGHCPYCKARKVNDWVFRLKQEDRVAISGYFVTLTYDTDNVPLCKSGMTLSPMEYPLMYRWFKIGAFKTFLIKFGKTKSNDLTRFFKKIRKRGENIRYYAVGEYGSKSWRPHYHIILFNIMDIQNIYESWKLGSVHIGEVGGASIGYTVKYLGKDTKVPQYPGDTRVPEFSRMSKGLGDNYLTDEIIQHFKNDLSKNYCYTDDGYKIALPSYYRSKIHTDKLTREIQRRIIENEIEICENKKKLSFESEDQFYKRREEIKLLKAKQFKLNISKRDKL